MADGDVLLPLINPQDNGEQLRPAGKGPDRGPQEASAVGQIMVNFTHSCPRAVFFLEMCSLYPVNP